MAIYDYRCEKCGASFEITMSMTSETRPTCTTCGSKATHRIPARVNIVFATEGFYHIDSGKRFESQLSPRGKRIWEKAKKEHA